MQETLQCGWVKKVNKRIDFTKKERKDMNNSDVMITNNELYTRGHQSEHHMMLDYLPSPTIHDAGLSPFPCYP